MTNDRPIRVCYHLQTHTNPDQVARLVEIIKRGSPDSVVVISHDEKARPLDTSRLERWPGVKVLLHPAVYGAFTHLDRLFAAVDWLSYHGVDFDWLVNLTGQDYPLRSISDIEKSLAECEHDGFLQYAPVFPKQTPASADWGAGPGYVLCEPLDARLRYKYRNWRVTRPTPFKQRWLRPLMALNLVQPWVSVSLAFGSVGVRRTSTIFSDDFICYGGSFSCTLSARSLYYARDFARENPFIVSFFNGVLGPDEIFLQTVLVNAQKFTFEPTNKRYIDFTGSRNNHPRILGVGDLESMLRSGHHWARKFSYSHDAKVLDLIDDHIGAKVLDLIDDHIGADDLINMDDLIAALRSANQRPPIWRQDRHRLYPVFAHFGRERILDTIPSPVSRLGQDDDRLTGSLTVTADTVAESTCAVDVHGERAQSARVLMEEEPGSCNRMGNTC
jgi:hypothetical protein